MGPDDALIAQLESECMSLKNELAEKTGEIASLKDHLDQVTAVRDDQLDWGQTSMQLLQQELTEKSNDLESMATVFQRETAACFRLSV